jgi:hypothetical protein
MPKGDDIVPFRLKRHQYARLKLMLAVTKYLGLNGHGYQNTVVLGTKAVEEAIREHCLMTGINFEDAVREVSGVREEREVISGNLDDGDDL